MEKRTNSKLTDAQKIKIIDNFCKHLEKGKCEFSFLEQDFRDIEEFAFKLDKKDKSLKLVEKIKMSLRKSFAYWEEKLFEMMNDSKKKYVFPIWIFYMKGRFHFGASEYKTKKSKLKNVEIDLCLDNDVKKIGK
jgi:hypothetical protein